MAETVRVLIEEEEVAKRIEELGKRSARIMRESKVQPDLCPEGRSILYVRTGKTDQHTGFHGLYECQQLWRRHVVKRRGKDCKRPDETLEGKDVLVVEDIIDSGRTLYYLLDILAKRHPSSMRLCTLLDKPERRVRDVKVDYVGFEIPDEFVVGYGLDYAQNIEIYHTSGL